MKKVAFIMFFLLFSWTSIYGEQQSMLEQGEIRDTLKSKIPFWKKIEFGIGYSGWLFDLKRDLLPWTSLGVDRISPWLNGLEMSVNFPLKGFDRLEIGCYIEKIKFKKHPISLKNGYTGAPDNIKLLNIAPFIDFMWRFQNNIFLRIGGIFFYCRGEEERKIYKDNIFIGNIKIKGKGDSKGILVELGKFWRLNFWINFISISGGIRGGGVEYYSDWYQSSPELDLSGIYIAFRFKFTWGGVK